MNFHFPGCTFPTNITNLWLKAGLKACFCGGRRTFHVVELVQRRIPRAIWGGGGLLRSQEPEKRTIIRPSTKAGHFLKVASCLMQCQGRLILAPLAGGTTAPPHFGEGANGASSRGAASRGAVSDPTSSGLGTSPGRIRLRTGSSEWAVS